MPKFFIVLAMSLCYSGLAQDWLKPDLLSGLKARHIGPAGMSGRVTDIVVAPSDQRIVYVGSASAGVWKSVNGGISFTQTFDDQKVHAIGALAFAGKDPDRLWVGTGEGNPRNSVSMGYGIFLTRDGGKTWEHKGLEKTERIHRILVHPNDPNTLYVAALGQMWGENPERGVFKTTDGGQTWQKVLYVDAKTGCADLVMDPRNPDKLIAAMWDYRREPFFFRSGGPGSGMFVTHDGGANWKRLTPEDGLPSGDLGRIGLAFAPSDPKVVYALVEAKDNVMLRSTDGGLSFEVRNREPNVNPRPFYYADLRVDPQWPQRVYRLASLVHVSPDGGRTFDPLPAGQWPPTHPDFHAMWIDPKNPEHMLIGNDGGVYESRDRGQTTRFLSNLPLAQYYHIAVDNESPYNIYGGMQDNGSWKGPSEVYYNDGIRNHFWSALAFGDGFDTLPDPEDHNAGYAMWQGGNLLRWDLNTGETYRIRPPQPTEGPSLRFNWNAALAQSPHDPGTIYYGSQFVHKSQDRGKTWKIISPDLTTNNPEWQKQAKTGGLTPDVTDAENYTTLVAIAPSPLDESVIWTGSDDGRLHVTRDGGKSWDSLEKKLKGVPANTWIPHIEPSKFKAGTAYVVLDNHRRSDWQPYVYRVDNFGAKVTSLSTPDLWGYALSFEQDSHSEELLFVGTEFGLYFSLNDGEKWHKFEGGLPTISVMDMALQERESDLVLGTHGMGAFVIDDISPLRALTSQVQTAALHFFPIPDTMIRAYRYKRGGWAEGAETFEGQNPPYGAPLTLIANGEALPHPDPKQERERQAAKRAEQAPKKASKSTKEATKEAEKTTEDAAKGQDPDDESSAAKKPGSKATVEIHDGDNQLVRRFEQELVQGLNRFTWELTGDPFLATGANADDPFAENGFSYGVAPGTYTATVTFGENVQKQSFKVLPLAGSNYTLEDGQARKAALERGRDLSDRLTRALYVLRRFELDIQNAEKKLHLMARLKGTKDKKDLEKHPLLKKGKELRKSLSELEKKIWVHPKTKGIVAESDLLTMLFHPIYDISSYYGTPSPSRLQELERVSTAVNEFLDKFHKDMDSWTEQYRQILQEHQIEAVVTIPSALKED